jgi:Fe-S-cluster containining protein
MNVKGFLQSFRVICLAPLFQKRLLWKLLSIFHKLDSHSEQFKKKTGLYCQSGCGKCCENPDVEATVLEMMPAAYELLRTKQSEKILLELQKEEKRCVFYKKEGEGRGRCLNYNFRPLICRLFGFSVKKDKLGQEQIVTCSIIKSKFTDELKKANLKKAPLMQDYVMKVFGLEPNLTRNQMPINVALRHALEKVLTRRS